MEDLTGDQLRQMNLNVAVELREGAYELSLFKDEKLPIRVPRDCRGHLVVAAGVPEKDSQSHPMLTSVELAFDQPLQLGNILAVLARLQTHFSDHELTSLINRLSRVAAQQSGLNDLRFFAGALFKRMRERLRDVRAMDSNWDAQLDRWGEAVSGSLRQAATVYLTRISARPVRRRRQWRLELRFTGEWDFFGQVRIPFSQVTVHRAILPSPHALLSRLLSAEPLATARLRRGHLPALTLAQEMAALLASFRGKLVANGISPDVDVSILMADHGTLELATAGRMPLEISAAVAGRTTPERLTVQFDDVALGYAGQRLRARGEFQAWTGPDGEGPQRSAVGRCLRALYAGEWSSDKLGLSGAASIMGGSRLPGLQVKARYAHPLMLGESELQILLKEIRLDGDTAASFGRPAMADSPSPARDGGEDRGADHRVDLNFHVRADVQEGSVLDSGRSRFFPRISGITLFGNLRSAEPHLYDLELKSTAQGRLDGRTRVEPFPELSIEEDELVSAIDFTVDLAMRVQARERRANPMEADFAGTRWKIGLDRTLLQLGPRSLTLPAGSYVEGDVREGLLAASGLGRAELGLTWDLRGESPILSQSGRRVELFVPPLRQGDLTVHLSPAGGITVGGEEWGLYDARYFNALLNPEDEMGRLLDILSSDEALDHVFAALEVFSPEAVRLLSRTRDFARKAQRILEEEDITDVARGIPAPTIARLASRVLFDTLDVQDELHLIVRRVVDGEGLDVVRLKRLLAEHYPDHEYDFELDRLLRLGARLLQPMDPVPRRRVQEARPLAETPAWCDRYEPFPTAARIYEVVRARAPLPPGFSPLLTSLAPYLTLEQMDYLRGRNRRDWRAEDLARLKHIHELKRRVREIERGYGGVAYAPQAVAIAFFLGETIRMSRGQEDAPPGVPGPARLPTSPYPLGTSLLGPRDVAILLHAGLASAWMGRAVQLNQRLLLDLIFEQPASFLRDVLVELGGNDPRVLTGALNALLAMPQSALRQPLDLVAEFGERLGFEIPRLVDFLAGGRRAKHSYYEALSETGDQILSQAEEYRALKFHVQEFRHPVSRGFRATRRKNALVKAAREAIAHADRTGARCTFAGPEPIRRSRARKAYRTAFAACRDLLQADPRAFQLPWFKEFWARNHEALVLLSVVRNVQEEVDQVPQWLAQRSGRPVPTDAQKLVDRVIEVLYYHPEDRDRLARDPLVRLLVEEPPGPYDFTLISCMGVITGGARGVELKQAYRRLEAIRSVKVIRADTATARSLEFNARRIIDAVKQTTTPWGYVGYSQGCPNGLMAENLLMGGTPEEQKLVEGLVCRNLLFSAFNASAHGTCGDQKFLQTMVYLDHFLAHYQARFSSRAIQLALSSIRFALDSRPFVLGLLGSRSLSVWGVIGLHRGGQFKSTAPTSTMRGIVEADALPECLEFLSNVLTRQIESTSHDTQVSTEEALGHSLLIRNEQTRVLEACDMGSLVQRTHHWSPLKEDTEFLTTRRDRERCIYEFPKDRHIFPWVEVNARFGLIKPAQ